MIVNTHIHNNKQVLDEISAADLTSWNNKVSKTGDTMAGNLNMNNHKVTNVTDPTEAQDAATKNYVDTHYVTAGKKSGTTLGTNATAEGINTTASGNNSHAEGNSTTAGGESSHAEGTGTIANHKSQHVFGEYNVEDSNLDGADARGDYIEIVGNGTGTGLDASNARTLDWNGNETLAGKLTVGTAPSNNMDVTNKQYVDNADSLKQDKQTAVTEDAPSAITLADNNIYYLTNVTALTFTYPANTHYECLIDLTTASSGTINITFPVSSSFIGVQPTFGNNERWEISIRDGIVAAVKVG